MNNRFLKGFCLFLFIVFCLFFSLEAQLPVGTVRKTVYTDTNNLILNGDLFTSNNFSVYMPPTLANHVVRLSDLVASSIDTNGNYAWTGTNNFYFLYGNGYGVTNLVSTNLVGDLQIVNFDGGTGASVSKFWRGDGTWSSVTGFGDVFSASNNTFTASNIFTGAHIISNNVTVTGNEGVNGNLITGDFFSAGTNAVLRSSPFTDFINNYNPGNPTAIIRNTATNGFSGFGFKDSSGNDVSTVGFENATSNFFLWNYSGILHAFTGSDQSKGMFFSDTVTTNVNTFIQVGSFTFTGSISGNGFGLTNLNSTNLVGIIPTARYGSEVVLTNASPIHIGAGTSATNNSVAIGMLGTFSDTTNSVAVGNNVEATGVGSSAFGNSSFVFNATKGTAVGYSAQVYGNNGVAVGNQAGAYGVNSVSIGNLTSALNDGTIAIGNGARATNNNSIVIGNAEAVIGSSHANDFTANCSGGYRFFGTNTFEVMGLIQGYGFGITNLNATNLVGIIPTARYGAEVVQTNNSVFVNAVTNIATTGVGTSLVSSVSSRIGLIKSIVPGSNITITDTPTNITIASTGGSSSGITNFTSNIPWITASVASQIASISTNTTPIPINSNTDNNAIGLTNFPANIVQTNNSVFTSIVTNHIRSVGATFSGATNVGMIVYQPVCFKGTIVGVQMVSTNAGTVGSAVLDIYKTNSFISGLLPTASIVASATPQLVNTNLYQDTTLTGWSKSVAADDVFAFKILSDTNCAQFSVTIKIQESN